MKYIVDADFVLETILNRSESSLNTVKFWEKIELKFDETYITSIGLERINIFIKLLAESEEDADKVTKLVTSNFQIIDIDIDILQEARGIHLNSNDFESAVEIVCAAEYAVNGIITDRKDSFKHTNPAFEISLKYPQQVIDPRSFHSYLNSKPNIKSQNTSALDSLVLSSETIVDLYIGLAKNHGGEEWGNYHINYDVIEKEWDNFQIVLTYCWQRAVLLSEDYYSKFTLLWSLLNRFSDLYGHWEERVLWLTRIVDLSKKKEEWKDYLFSLTSKAWTLIMIDKLDEAKNELNCASDLLVDDHFLMFNYYHCLCMFHTRKKEFNKAQDILVKQRYLFGLMKEQKVEERILTRCDINFIRNSAKIDHEEGVVKLDNKDNIGAKALFACAERKMLSCLKLSIDINWQRGICYLDNKIANINLDIALATDDYEEKKQLIEKAEKYLRLGEPIAILHQRNSRRRAGYFLSFGRLEIMKNRLGMAEMPSTYPENSANSLSNAEIKAKQAMEIYQDIGDKRRAGLVTAFFPELDKKLKKLNLA